MNPSFDKNLINAKKRQHNEIADFGRVVSQIAEAAQAVTNAKRAAGFGTCNVKHNDGTWKRVFRYIRLID